MGAMRGRSAGCRTMVAKRRRHRTTSLSRGRASFKSSEPCSAEALPGRPLPSMARHYTPSLSPPAEHGSALHPLPPFRVAKGRAGEGLALRRLRLRQQGTAATKSSSCSAEPCSAQALPGRPLPSMARHYPPSLSRSEGEDWGGVGSSPVAAAQASQSQSHRKSQLL